MLRRRVEDRTTADRLAEGLAEMTQARIPNLGCGFGHVVTPAAQKLGRAFHPRVAQELRNRQAQLPAKKSGSDKRGCSRPPARAFPAWEDWPDRAQAIPLSARPGRAPLSFAACKKIPDLSVRKENATSARAPCSGTRGCAPLSAPAARPGWPRSRAARSTSVAAPRRCSGRASGKWPTASPASGRSRNRPAGSANVLSNTPG